MSSAGKISPLITGAYTDAGVTKRQEQFQGFGTTDFNDAILHLSGVVSEIHPERLLVKAREQSSGVDLCWGRWIPLRHTAQEIAEKYGTVKLGMVVKIECIGRSQLNATATIVHTDTKGPGEEEFVANEMATGLYEIFKPGI